MHRRFPIPSAAALAGVLALAAVPAFAGNGSTSTGWKRIDATGAVKGIDGKQHTARCSGYPGTDPTFRFWTRTVKNAKNLVVYFEGGGACWDDVTCSFPMVDGLPASVPQFFMPQVPAATDPSAMQGLFTDDAANPVRDWNVVYIPYCSGDLHTGSTSKTYYNAGHPVFPLPSSFTLEHRGFDNFVVALEWARRNLPKPKQVLVAGVSGGGYGATANSPWVGKAFPQAKLSVVADSSQGVTTRGFDFGRPGRGDWNPQLASWVFGNPASLPGPELMQRAAAGQPKARFAQVTTQLDEVQIGFYGYMKQYYGPGGSCPNPAIDWNRLMLGQLATDAKQPNFRHYLSAGQYHTLLAAPNFYGEASAGPVFVDWLAEMLAEPGHANENNGHGPGSGWQDVACPGCLNPIPCS